MSTAITPATAGGLEALITGRFQPVNADAAHPVAYAHASLPRSVREQTFGKVSAAHTPIATVMVGSPVRPSSADTGRLDTAFMTRRVSSLRRGDTKGSALLRTARASGVGASAPVLNVAAARAIAAQVASARDAAGAAATVAPLDVRPVTAAGVPPLWKSAHFSGAVARTNLDGRPGTSVCYAYGALGRR